jgi:hypothetical protein
MSATKNDVFHCLISALQESQKPSVMRSEITTMNINSTDHLCEGERSLSVNEVRRAPHSRKYYHDPWIGKGKICPILFMMNTCLNRTGKAPQIALNEQNDLFYSISTERYRYSDVRYERWRNVKRQLIVPVFLKLCDHFEVFWMRTASTNEWVDEGDWLWLICHPSVIFQLNDTSYHVYNPMNYLPTYLE